MLLPSKPKFDLGSSQEDLPGARIGVESGLVVQDTPIRHVKADRNISLGDDFTFVWFESRLSFIIQKHVAAVGTSNTDFFNIRNNVSALVVPVQVVLAVGTGTKVLFNGTTSPIPPTNQDSIDDWACYAISINSSTGDVNFYYNDILIATENEPDIIGYTWVAPLRIGSFWDGTFSGNSRLNNMIILDRLVTESELQYIRQNGGAIPESTHDVCLAHYPLTHRYAPLPNFFGAGQHAIIDVVEQYNYAKALNIIQPANTAGLFTAGTAFANAIPSGDFLLEWEHELNLNSSMVVGLDTASVFTDRNAIDFCIQITSAGAFIVKESGVNSFVGPGGGVTVGDTCSIKRVGTTLEYALNGVIQYTNPGPVPTTGYNFHVTGNGGITSPGTEYTNPRIDGRFIKGVELFQQNMSVVNLRGISNANHGELINYTDAELGVTDKGLMTSFKDSYSKRINNWGGFVGSSGSYWRNTSLSGTALSGNYTIVIRFRLTQQPAVAFASLVSTTGGAGGFLFTRLTPSASNYSIVWFLNNTSQTIVTAKAYDNDFHYIVLSADRSGGNSHAFFDGQRLEPGVTGIPAGDFLTDYGNLEIFRENENSGRILDIAEISLFQFFDGLLVDTEEQANYLRIQPPTVPDIELVFNGDTASSSLENSGSLSAQWALIGTADFIEVHSGFPEPVKALEFNGTSQYLRWVNNGNYPANTNGYTFMWGFRTISERTLATGDQIMRDENELQIRIEHASGFDWNWNVVLGNGQTVFNMYGTPTDTQIQSTDVNIEALTYYPDPGGASILSGAYINGSFFDASTGITYPPMGLDELVNDITIMATPFAARYTEGYMYFFAVWSRVLSAKEIKRIHNNSLIRSPSIKQQDNLELYIDFNNPFDDTGTLKFPDLSPNAFDIEIVSFANLAAVQAALVDINSLR